jgi:hypothetical protein
MTTDNMHKAWYEWMAQDEWTYFGTATFKDELTKSAAEKRFTRFMRQAQDTLRAGLRCVYVTEGGNATKRTHIHFLIGGIPYSPAVRRQLQGMWNRMGGISHIARFNKAKREAGIHYTLKTVRTGESDQVNLIVPDKAKASQPATVAKGSQTRPAPKADQLGGPLHHRKGNAGRSPRTASPRASAAVPANTNAATITLPAMTIKRGHGYHVRREGDYLILVLPLTTPRPSSTGKTNVIGSTGGPRVTFAEFDGRPILLNAVAMVKPKGPAWKQRIYAVLARWEGKLS